MDSMQAAEPGLDSAGLAEAPKLLCSATELMEELAAELKSYGEQRKTRMLGCKVAAELQVLKACMLQIWCILLSAGNIALARQARDATYGVEELQDIVEYHRLQSLLEAKVRHRLQSALMFWKRVIACAPERRRFLKDIKVVTQETRELLNLFTRDTNPLASMDSVLQTHGVLGRDKERDDLVQMLIQPCATEMLGVSIVGAAGVGKTTLAQMVFNDPRVGHHFHVTSWVSVPRSSGQMELAAEILLSAQPAWDGSPDKMVDFQTIQSELRQFIASRRCLIVLDGAWASSSDEICRDILLPLQSADTGSRILVTSPTNVLPASQLYTLDPLSADHCWALLKEHAFPAGSDDVHPDLELIGREIAAKIHGSPLTAKLIGGVLGASRSKEHWKNVRETATQDDPVSSALRLSYSFLPAHLKRCFAYCSLFPQHWKFDPARLILLWIAEGFVEPQITDERRMEDMAREYFDQLLARSFFQELKLGSKAYYTVHSLLHHLAESVAEEDCFRIEQGTNRDIPSTVRHLSVSMNSLHSLTSFAIPEKLRTLLIQRPSTCCIKEDFVGKLKGLLGKSKNLRVLDLSGLNSTELLQCIADLFHLRYLSIHGLPESIGKLLHLQTLFSTEKCSRDNLPASITMLVNLRHLGVETKCTAGLVGIARLTNLQGSLAFHVDKSDGRKLEELSNINGLRGSLSLNGLENVSSNEEACKAQLNKKRYLNSLSLEWSSATTNLHPPAYAQVLEGLQPPQDIRELCIRRYRGSKTPSWLQVPSLQQLRSLHLINCRSMGSLPPLGHLRSLRYLHMKEMCAVEQIGHEFYGTDDVAFPSLSNLELDDFPRLHDWSGITGRNSFPCLERLIIMDCPELMKIPSFLPVTSEVTIERTRFIPHMRLVRFSSTSEMLQLDVCRTSILDQGLLHKQQIESIVALNITAAEQLTAAEELGSLVSLQRLQLSGCNFTDQTFSLFLQALPCLSKLEIIDLPNITSLLASGTLKFCTRLTELCIRNCQLLHSISSIQFFGSLQCLVIERCPNLTAASFPENFGKLSSLKVLRISYCLDFQSLPVCGLPSSLETLHIIGCHPELSRQSRNRNGHYFWKLAFIPRVLIQ